MRGVAEARDALTTVTDASARALREETVDILADLGHADAIVTYPLARVQERIALDLARTVVRALPAHLLERFASAFDEWVGFSGLLEPARQQPIERRELLEYDAIVPRPKAQRTPFYREILGPAGIVDQQRLLVYDGPRFAGWVGFLRGRGRPFTLDDRRRLRALVAPLKVRLRLARRLDDDARIEEAAELILGPDGHIRHASRAGRRWLELEGLAEGLTREVRAFDRGAEPRPRVLSGAAVYLSRLDGQGGVAYLASLRPASPLEMHPLDALPPSLRRVADAVAEGLSDKEIATALGLPLSTARTYVTRAMKRLGVNHRAKLALLAMTPSSIGAGPEAPA